MTYSKKIFKGKPGPKTGIQKEEEFKLQFLTIISGALIFILIAVIKSCGN